MTETTNMETKVYKPLVDKLFYLIAIPTALLLFGVTLISIFTPIALLVIIPMDLFTAYFIISPLFGRVQLTEEAVFIKFGFFLTRVIPYSKIRRVEKTRKWYSDSMLSLKNSMEHVNIAYNRFDIVSVSVKDNDAFVYDLTEKLKKN